MMNNKLLKHYLNKENLEVGVDEAGRGCLAGRVYAAAVIWNPNIEKIYNVKLPPIKDSKKIKYQDRKRYSEFIKKYAVDWGIGWASEKEIDEINIKNATFKSMHRALDNLHVRSNFILVDGNIFEPYTCNKSSKNIKHQTVIKGDDTYFSIAAASILAKVSRDEYIEELVRNNPELNKYDWLNNYSYGSKKHINAIKNYGITNYHRKTFGICKIYDSYN